MADYNKKLVDRFRKKKISEEDYCIPKLLEPGTRGFQTLRVVKAGDGGYWVPVYVYVGP